MDKLKGICILVLTFFSFGLTVFFMPFQVYEVFSALDSEVLEAEIIDSEFDRYSDVGFRNSCIIEVELKILSSNENIIIGDGLTSPIIIFSLLDNIYLKMGSTTLV